MTESKIKVSDITLIYFKKLICSDENSRKTLKEVAEVSSKRSDQADYSHLYFTAM